MKKIKVLHIGHSKKWRGGENQVKLLIETQNKLGFNTEHFLAYPKQAIIVERLNGIVKGCVPLPTGKPIDIRSIWKIVHFCKKHNIDVLHAHSGNSHTIALICKRFLPNVKVIVHRRVDNKIKQRSSTKRKYLTEKVSRFIAVSLKINQIMTDYGVSDGKVSLIYDSIDEQPYQDLDKETAKDKIVEQYNWDKKDTLIGFVAAIENQKNPELFVDIIADLHIKGIKINAVIAGQGARMDSVKEKISGYGLEESIKCLGFVNNISDVFSALDIFVLTSRNEGLGTVLLEAISAKAAIVASNVGGIPEVIIDTETGLLAESENKETFVTAITQLLDDETVREKLVNAATKHQKDLFKLDEMAEKTNNLYQEIVAE